MTAELLFERRRPGHEAEAVIDHREAAVASVERR